jgi:aminomethyltransferase
MIMQPQSFRFSSRFLSIRLSPFPRRSTSPQSQLFFIAGKKLVTYSAQSPQDNPNPRIFNNKEASPVAALDVTVEPKIFKNRPKSFKSAPSSPQKPPQNTPSATLKSTFPRMSESTALKRTPLFGTHLASKARMVDFGGWNMPVQYSSIIEEHQAVRTAVGLFDVSHMGEIEVRGPQALELVNYIATNNAAKLKPGQAHYSALLYEHGGAVDDILVHRLPDGDMFLCVNASNQEKDFEHIQQITANRFDAAVDLASDRYAQIAVQGPKGLATLQKLTTTNLSEIKYYWFTDGKVSGTPARIARTGYTGEDGFEIYVPPNEAARLWNELLTAGEEFAIRPCGLGARNTLRLEAGMALYGHELTASINPLEANLGWIVKMDKGDFVGRAALEKVQAAGLTRTLVGFEMQERGIGRDGYEVWIAGKPAGWVTSGGPSPTLNKNIGLCFLPVAAAQNGATIQVVIRNTPVQALTVPAPFYKRAKA